MRSLIVLENVLFEMVEACQKAFPHEACGLLGGRGDVAYTHYPLRNVAHTPTENFEGDHREHMLALQQMQAKKQELVAIYHSHPRTPAVPSRTDIERAFYPKAFYAIISLAQWDRPVMRVFRLNPHLLRSVELHWWVRRQSKTAQM